MADYMIMAEVGNALVRLLRKELVPELIKSDAGIGLASPADKGDISLCVHLYDVNESKKYRVSGMITEGVDSQKFPPIHLTLSYMITAFSASDVKFRSEEEQRILGRVSQVLLDYPIFDPDTMEFGTGGGEDKIWIEMVQTDIEERSKVWNFPNLAPKLSLFYSIGPVAVESSKTKKIRRVQEIEFRGDAAGKPFAKLFRRKR